MVPGTNILDISWKIKSLSTAKVSQFGECSGWAIVSVSPLILDICEVTEIYSDDNLSMSIRV